MITKFSNNYFDFYTLSAVTAGAHVLIVAGIHGDEFEPMLAALNLINRLPGKLIRGKVTILAVANPPAYHIGKRCGIDQLDLARTLPGRASGTPTEVIANEINKIILQADFMIDLHTGGALFDIMPLSGYMLHPNKKVLATQRQMAQAFNLPLIWGTDAAIQGRTLSVARDHDIPAMYVECGGGSKIMKKTVGLYEEGCMRVLNMLGLLNNNYKKEDTVQTRLEDHRPGKGHLQSKLPAPIAGIFVPEMSLGKQVKQGSILGRIIDPLLNTNTTVCTEEEGMLFMLRISGHVNEGDSLGGLIPVVKNKRKVIYA